MQQDAAKQQYTLTEAFRALSQCIVQREAELQREIAEEEKTLRDSWTRAREAAERTLEEMAVGFARANAVTTASQAMAPLEVLKEAAAVEELLQVRVVVDSSR